MLLPMSSPQPEGQRQVSREAVKTLAIAVGVREAARQLGLPEPTVQSWSRRDKWFAQPPLPPTITNPNSASIASKTPSAAFSDMVDSGHNIKILSLKEKREYLASVVRTPVGSVNEDSPLAQKVKRSSRTDKRGETTETEEIEIPGKLRAIELDARLAGELDTRTPDGGLVSVTLVRLELPNSLNEKVVEGEIIP